MTTTPTDGFDQQAAPTEGGAPVASAAPGSTWNAQPGGAPQPYGQPGYGAYAPQPPKKKHTVRNVILIVIGVCILGIGGCSVLVIGGAAKVANDIEKSDNAPGGPKNPLAITQGKAFEVQGFSYAAGWSVGNDEILGTTVKDLKVTNNRKDRDGAIVEVKFLKGTEVLGTVDCTTEQIQVGQTVTLNCLGTTKPVTGWDKITINDTF
ncbi:hypothetical protein PZ938_09035 [Luteipulveratus sp. YIM 133132]|uniref:hypothetical protein n=1 Tax=Luteipulveratus flavus TaxID=3031728 RepID=UPI0023AE6D75|nr:hypothetical protein [Luteipulveratus sp. YIM 133132]MDE9365747.1 hypothetical protein [Luteipulveratus sp. YIM 133132]